MLTCFVQTVYKKDTILVLEGKKLEYIIFVKDGHLILEATIDLYDPFTSIQRYFQENFRGFDINELKDKNNMNISINTGEKVLEQGNEENTLL